MLLGWSNKELNLMMKMIFFNKRPGFKMYEDSKCYCSQCGQVYGSIRDLKRHEKLEHYD